MAVYVAFLQGAKQENKKEMNGDFVSAFCELKGIIRMVNIFLIYICHFIALWKADIKMEEVQGIY